MHEYVKMQVRSAGRLDARQWSPVWTAMSSIATSHNLILAPHQVGRHGGTWEQCRWPPDMSARLNLYTYLGGGELVFLLRSAGR